MQTLLINLYGAPCSGKSVKMMQLAIVGKLRRLFCEISAEVAKEYIVQNIPITREIQLELSAEQDRRHHCFVGHTEVLITDAPVLIGAFYSHYRKISGLEEIDTLFRQRAAALQAKAHRVVNVYMWRDHPYDASGRIESESEDETIAKLMWQYVQDRCPDQILLEARSTENPETLWDRIQQAAK